MTSMQSRSLRRQGEVSVHWIKMEFTPTTPGGGTLQLRLYGAVWPQDRKTDPSVD